MTNEINWLLNELSKMPPMVIETAYLHATNYTKYGVDVTEKFLTATQNAFALERAYREGYYDALHDTLQRIAENDDGVQSEEQENETDLKKQDIKIKPSTIYGIMGKGD